MIEGLLRTEQDNKSSLELTTNRMPTFNAQNMNGILEQFELEMRKLYAPPELYPYHNWGAHIPDVLSAAWKLCERLEQLGMPIDRNVIYAGVIGHDAGYALDHRAAGFVTKEDHSAHIAAEALRRLGTPESFISQVSAAIQETERSRVPQTLEAKILRAADLSGVGGTFDAYERGTRLLYAEFNRTKLERMSFDEFVAWQADKVLSDYLAVFIQLSAQSLDEVGRSIWHTAALGNILRICSERKSIAFINPGELPENCFEHRQFTGDELLVGFSAKEELIEDLTLLRTWRGNNNAPALVVPGSLKALSSPDAIVNELHFVFEAKSFKLEEEHRVLAPGGLLKLYLRPTQDDLVNLLREHLSGTFTDMNYLETNQLDDWRVITFQKSW